MRQAATDDPSQLVCSGSAVYAVRIVIFSRLGSRGSLTVRIESVRGFTRQFNSAEAEMKDDRGRSRRSSMLGEQAARKRRPKQANPYLLPPRGDAAQLLDEASRKLLADAWLRGWTREMGRRSS